MLSRRILLVCFVLVYTHTLTRPPSPTHPLTHSPSPTHPLTTFLSPSLSPTDISRQTQQLEHDTATSKKLHLRKSQVVEKRLQEQTRQTIEALRQQVCDLQTTQSDELDGVQNQWNEARHQLNFEREIVATQRTKIVSLLQTIEANEQTLTLERQEYEQKCTGLAHIQDEQRASLMAIYDKFEACRNNVLQEKKNNQQLLLVQEELKQQLVAKEQLLHKETLAKKYLQSNYCNTNDTIQHEMTELNLQLQEEIQLRTFAQEQWDEEVEKNKAKELKHQKNLASHKSIQKELKQDISRLMLERTKVQEQHALAVNTAVANMFDAQRKEAHVEIQKREDLVEDTTQKMEEMKANHAIELQLIASSHQEDRDTLMQTNIDALDALRSEMHSKNILFVVVVVGSVLRWWLVL